MNNKENCTSIRRVRETDAERLAEIYNYYISNTTITFETEEIDAEEMRKRIVSFSGKGPYYVFEEDGIIKGYCYAHQWKVRKSYANTYEVTIYLDKDCKGQGIGQLLMSKLIDTCREMGLHILIACVTNENRGSTMFHEKMGFVNVSHFKEVGCKFGRWLDVSDFELVF